MTWHFQLFTLHLSLSYRTCSYLVRIPDPWNSSLEFGLEFQGSGVATALEQHTENSMAIPPYTIKVWCQFLQNITSMLFFFQMNGVLTYLSIWKDSLITHLCWSVLYFHGVKLGIRCFYQNGTVVIYFLLCIRSI